MLRGGDTAASPTWRTANVTAPNPAATFCPRSAAVKVKTGAAVSALSSGQAMR